MLVLMLEENGTCDKEKQNERATRKYLEKYSHTYLCSCVVYADADADVFSFVFDEMSCALHRQQRVLRARGSERLRGFSFFVSFLVSVFSP